MTDCNKVIKDIEYAKDLLQNRPEQDTVDYKVYEVLDDALDLIHDLRSQIAMLVAAQHELCEMMKEQEAKTVIKIAKRFNDCDLTGFCPFCSRPLIKDWAENYCGYCGKPVLWEGR